MKSLRLRLHVGHPARQTTSLRRRVLPKMPLALVAFAVIVSANGACTTIQEGTNDGTTTDAPSVDVPVEQDVSKPDDVTVTGDTPLVEGGFLWACDDNADCNSGWCVPTPEGKQCSRPCIDKNSCPVGWGCSPIATQGRDTAYICIPVDTDLCRPCAGDSECNQPGAPQAGHCMQLGDFGSLCSRTCDTDAACPAGFNCQPVQPKGPNGPTLDLCFPSTEEACSCTQRMVDVGATTSCKSDNAFGSCEGQFSCGEVGTFPACDAPGAQPEVCNAVDDDCNGEVDDTATDCTVYYQDSDGDGYGLGDGECLCAKPDDSWVELGGDCNELVTSINPGVAETCNGTDDNCDGQIDEAGADGCVPSYPDGDNDNYGVETPGVVPECHCTATEGWAPNLGDCDDANPLVSPGVQESCNGGDDDCDGGIDEADAVGCNPYFIDGDGDTYGLTTGAKCLCGPTGAYLATIPGDCDDTTGDVSPGLPEICDGVDNNCDNQTDEGGGDALCPGIANGSADCLTGSCQLVSCDTGWTDADGDPLNGCECNAGLFEGPGSPGQQCSSPQILGTVSDLGQALEVSDNIAPAGDEDWYSFTAIDGADSATGTSTACDTFHVRVYFLHNPGEQFTFDVYRKGVTDADVCSNQRCSDTDDFSDFTDTNSTVGGSLVGECPCTTEAANSVSKPPNVQLCSDNTAEYRIRVYRKPGLPDACASYTLRVENGDVL